MTRPVVRAPRFFSAESVASAAPTQYCAPVGAPPAETVAQTGSPVVPAVWRYWPEVPAANAIQAEVPRKMICPLVEPKTESKTEVTVLKAGAAVEAVALPNRVLAAAVERLKVRAGVEDAVATEVVKSGANVPALKEVTVPVPVGTVQVPPRAQTMPLTVVEELTKSALAMEAQVAAPEAFNDRMN
jgi:hypothetical protein